MQFKKHAFILAVIEALRRHGSWTGKTHVQKALSLLGEAGLVDVPFQFVLYKHGPYSFEIEGELEQMQSYGAITVEANSQGYGVVLQQGGMARFVQSNESLTEEELAGIESVCEFVGSRNVADLERLATASWIRSHENLTRPADVARRLHDLKPHVSTSEAERAYEEVTAWIAQGIRPKEQRKR